MVFDKSWKISHMRKHAVSIYQASLWGKRSEGDYNSGTGISHELCHTLSLGLPAHLHCVVHHVPLHPHCNSFTPSHPHQHLPFGKGRESKEDDGMKRRGGEKGRGGGGRMKEMREVREKRR